MKLNAVIMCILVSTLLLAGCSSTTSNTVASKSSGSVREISLDAFNWGFSQPTIKVKKGERIRLKVSSSSGRHGVAIPEFGVSTKALSTGNSDYVEFTAGEEGSYGFFCNVPCGHGHMSMTGQIVVE